MTAPIGSTQYAEQTSHFDESRQNDSIAPAQETLQQEPHAAGAPLSAERVDPRDGFSDLHAPTDKTAAIGQGINGLPTAFDPSDMDLSVDPRHDFYNYAVGSWRKANPVPEGYSTWGFGPEIAKRNSDRLQTLLLSGSLGDSHEDKLSQIYFDAYNDIDARTAAGLAPIQSILDKIDGIQTHEDLVEALADLIRWGVSPFFGFGAEGNPEDSSKRILWFEQGGLNLPDFELYDASKDTESNRNEEKRCAYGAFARNLLSLAGRSEAGIEAAS
ncbi:MAG: hypothetical protein KDK78_08610, partial [Chlamydiia bacterium]|nr:hypothetical protein [Chlamydiia bacterium]